MFAIRTLARTSTFRLFLITLALICTAGVRAVDVQAAASQGEVIHEGRFTADQYSWSGSADGGLHPVLRGGRTLVEPGLPQLPSREMLFLVPIGTDVARAWIEPLTTRREAMKQPLPLAPAHATDAGELLETRILNNDTTTFPATWARFGGTHVWRGYRLLALTVYPVRQVTENGVESLEYLDEYAVRVQYKAARDAGDIVQRERMVAGESRRIGEMLTSLVENPEVMPSYARQAGKAVAEPGGGFQPTIAPSLAGSAVRYLIITNNALKPTFQQLADFKTAQGLPAIVVSREEIAATSRNGADIQETMRMYIQDAYALWGVEYVLLGGDTDILPPRYINNSFYPASGSTAIPCDLYFACLDGNWNDDGDSQFGEPAKAPDPGDLVDFAEEIYIGRAAVSDVAAASVFVNKVISYESTPADAQWPNRALFAAEVLFPSDFEVQGYIILDGAQFADQQVNDHIIPCTTMEYTRMYETDLENPRDAPLTRAALIDSLNTGHYGIFNQIGHGYYFNMSVGDANFMTTDADALTNGDHLFMMYALNCASAAFDNSCLMERFVQNPNGGSVVSLGSARAAFPNNSNNYQQNFFSELYCLSENRTGNLMAMSRLPFIAATVDNYVDRWTFENYTLLGDPALRLWTGVPAAVAVAGPTSISPGPQNLTYTITAGGSPVAGAEVCLNKAGEDYVYGMTDAAGQVTFDFLAASEGNAVLTVTGNNLALKTVNVAVNAGTSYFTLNAMSITDNGGSGSAGNGNGVVETGETVALTPTLLETGGFAESGLSAIMTCDNPSVTIVDGSANFFNVSAGGQTAASSPFLATFDPNIPDGTRITFEFAVTGTGGSYVVRWGMNVAGPELEVVDLDWDDSVYGNGDGLQGNNERLVFTVRLKNYGSGQADQVTGVLQQSGGNFTIYASGSNWSNLNLMDEADGNLMFSAAVPNIVSAYNAWITFTDNYGRSFQHQVSFPRPLAPLNIQTDTSLGADVIALSWDPSATAGVYGYNVYRSLNSGGPFVRVNEDVVAGTSYYRDEGLGQLTRYYYQVASVADSRVPSVASAVVDQATAPAEREGFPVDFNDETSGNLAVGDVDGDGDEEIVLASSQVYVWHHDGLELLDGDNDSQTLGNFTDLPTGTLLQPGSVALADLDGVPGDEIIISERAPGYFIHIYRYDGTELPGWPQSLSGSGVVGSKWNWTAPTIGDIDGDGNEDIIVNTLNGRIWAWHADGTEVWDGDGDPGTNGLFYVRPGADWEWSRSGPSLWDLDHDGARDVIFGTKNDATGQRRLMAVKYDGSDVPGFPYIANGPINCDPALGDLDGDGQIEIVFFDKFKYVYAVRQDGTDYPGFPKLTTLTASDSWVSSPALGDMDGDGMLEIIYAPNATGLLGKIVVMDTDYAGGTSGEFLPGFPVAVPGSSESGPIVADIDGDGSPDILHGIGGGDESAPYNLYAYHADGTAVDGFPITLTGPLMATVTVTDIDNDGDVDIVYGGWDFQTHVWDMPFAYNPDATPWPTFAANTRRNGVITSLFGSDVSDRDQIPANGFTVMEPYPNPFNPSTSVRMYIPAGGNLELAVYDIAGRKVRSLHSGGIGAGWHTLVWDGQDDSGRGQASGLYFMRAKSGDESSIHKMTLVK